MRMLFCLYIAMRFIENKKKKKERIKLKLKAKLIKGFLYQILCKKMLKLLLEKIEMDLLEL
ncbi:Uncharacterised protein [Campylobacter jejuni]|nr:Uncharacterised protein [Campylobacter jejuni]